VFSIWRDWPLYARNCPQAVNKRKAETPAEDEVLMVENTGEIDNINIHDDDGTESEPDDTAIWDCGAASVLVSRSHLRRYVKMLMIAGYDVHKIKAWTCEKGFRFGKWEQGQDKLVCTPADLVSRRTSRHSGLCDWWQGTFPVG